MTDQLDDRAPISPAAFADGVLDEVLDLDDETRDEAFDALSAWWGKWTDQAFPEGQTDQLR